MPYAKALYTFHAQDSGQLFLEPGDELLVDHTTKQGWVFGEHRKEHVYGSRKGYFPRAYVELIEDVLIRSKGVENETLRGDLDSLSQQHISPPTSSNIKQDICQNSQLTSGYLRVLEDFIGTHGQNSLTVRKGDAVKPCQADWENEVWVFCTNKQGDTGYIPRTHISSISYIFSELERASTCTKKRCESLECFGIARQGSNICQGCQNWNMLQRKTLQREGDSPSSGDPSAKQSMLQLLTAKIIIFN